jgi:hypothetical protein
MEVPDVEASAKAGARAALTRDHASAALGLRPASCARGRPTAESRGHSRRAELPTPWTAEPSMTRGTD